MSPRRLLQRVSKRGDVVSESVFSYLRSGGVGSKVEDRGVERRAFALYVLRASDGVRGDRFGGAEALVEIVDGLRGFDGVGAVGLCGGGA